MHEFLDVGVGTLIKLGKVIIVFLDTFSTYYLDIFLIYWKFKKHYYMAILETEETNQDTSSLFTMHVSCFNTEST